MYTAKDLDVTKIEKTDRDAYDSLYIEIKTSDNKKIIFGVVYRPPRQNEENDKLLYTEIENAIDQKDSVIVGDFNNPNINWKNLTADAEGNRLLELMEDNFMSQVVSEPTREKNTLDLVLTTDNDMVSNCQVGEKLGTSDHHIIRFTLDLN